MRASLDEAPGALVMQFGATVAIIFASVPQAKSPRSRALHKVTPRGLAVSALVAETVCNHLGCSHKKRMPESFYERSIFRSNEDDREL